MPAVDGRSPVVGFYGRYCGGVIAERLTGRDWTKLGCRPGWVVQPT